LLTCVGQMFVHYLWQREFGNLKVGMHCSGWVIDGRKARMVAHFRINYRRRNIVADSGELNRGGN